MLDGSTVDRRADLSGSEPPPVPPEQVFRLLDQIVPWVCRSHHCAADEAEEFASEARMKVIATNYAVVRKYRGTSTLCTYLSVVVQNWFKDYRNHRWGKWRPSAEATRLGKLAVKLEELLWKDNLSLAEACETLLANRDLRISRRELEELAARLPTRPRRHFEGEDSLHALPATTGSPEERLLAKEGREALTRAAAALERALDALPDEDRLILRLSYEQDFKVADIARYLCLDQKGLYRRIEKIRDRLKDRLQAEGVRWEDIRLGREM